MHNCCYAKYSAPPPMTNSSFSQTSPPNARAVDEAVHERLSQFTMGLSPISLALACADPRQKLIGQAIIDGETVNVIDTPGVNELAPRTEDARVTCDVLRKSSSTRAAFCCVAWSIWLTA